MKNAVERRADLADKIIAVAGIAVVGIFTVAVAVFLAAIMLGTMQPYWATP